ncbi:YceD family protein [Flexivirga sp.]|uniref:YceD family protein n=1 Tax=Flexivirga sp. TaxID=1962927 RepID=UPI003F7EA5B1
MHTDTRRPLALDTKELPRRPGRMLEGEVQVAAPEHFGTEVIGVPEGQPMTLRLRLESVMEGVLVTGTVHATATGACVRCLEPVDLPIEVPFQELFAYADRAARHHEVEDGDEEDVHELDGDLADLEPVLRDAVVPALPFQPVCRDDCPGLCSECGARLADDPTHHHEVIDPRWSALAHLAGGDDDTDNDEKRN